MDASSLLDMMAMAFVGGAKGEAGRGARSYCDVKLLRVQSGQLPRAESGAGHGCRLESGG